MHRAVEEALDAYHFHRDLLLELLRSLGPRDLLRNPISNSGSLGKQFRHLLDIQNSYVDSLTTNTLDFYRDHVDHTIETDKENLIRAMEKADHDLDSVILDIAETESTQKKIDGTAVVKYLGVRYQEISALEVLKLLQEHEIFHQGGLALYVRALGMRFPDGWMLWGLK